MISLRFRDEHSADSARKYWQFWYSRQTDVEEARGIELGMCRYNNIYIYASAGQPL